jgi:hypothetical protein
LTQEHDPEKHALGRRPDGCVAVFLATNAGRVCAEIMLNQKLRSVMAIQPNPIALYGVPIAPGASLAIPC